MVITQRWRMRHHIKKGEQLFVVPDLLVQEPVPFERVLAISDHTHKYVLSRMAPVNKCGGCTACCITPYLKTQTFTKLSHQRCIACNNGGCQFYWTRPLQCQTFECLWLKSQITGMPMGPELRPDRARVILTGPEQPGEPADLIYIHPDVKAQRGSESCYMSARMSDWLIASGRPTMIVTHYRGENGA